MTDHQSGAAPGAMDVVRQHYAAIKAGDMEADSKLIAEGVDWRLADGYGLAGTYVGTAAVGVIFPALQKELDSYTNVAEQLIQVNDETVLSTGTYSGVGRETGETMRAEFAHLWTVQNGKIVALRQFTNTAEWQRVLGPGADKRMAEDTATGRA